ncbi:MAG: NusA antitermination factor, utilization substance protein, partial [Patescibacteria group bacterium]|nr:NusA antitermination factor, utilization substance protein [Patescibacteria group bacterium]
MQTPNFLAAINMIAEEKNLPRDIIIETVEAALAAAYKKDYSDKDQEARAELDQETGEVRIYESKTVVPDGEVENDFLQIALSDAKKINKDAIVREANIEEGIEPYMVEMQAHPEDFGRVAAQTAKQVIIQRLREAEREIIFTEYKDKEGIVLNGSVQRVEGNMVYVDLGKATGILFASEQIPGERYYTGQRLKVYVVRVEQTARGPQIVLSRAHANMVKHLFELEVPEIEAGTVEIMNIAREAGIRSKVAVQSHAAGVDAVGTFVGGRGSRVQAVMGDLGEEKIDIIPFSDNSETYIANALSPTKVVSVSLNDVEKKAIVRVPEDQLSLAIGKQGQNVRLAAKLTGWNIDILSADESRIEATAEAAAAAKRDLEGDLIAAINSGADEPVDPAM